MRGLTVIVCVLILSCVLSVPSREFHKKLAGPPSEFASMVLPKASNIPSVRFSSTYPLVLEAKDGVYEAQVKLALTKSPETTFSVLTPKKGNIKLSLKQEGSKHARAVDVESLGEMGYEVKKSTGPYALDGMAVPSISYTISKLPTGPYTVTITSDEKMSGVSEDSPNAVLVMGEDSQFGLYTHMSDFDYDIDRNIGIVAQLFDSKVSGRDFVAAKNQDIVRPVAYDKVQSGNVRVTTPSGKQFVMDLTDNGDQADYAAGDHIYGAKFNPLETGVYMLEVTMTGVDPQGVAFERATYQIMPVKKPIAQLTGVADMAINKAQNIMTFNVHVDDSFAEEEASRVKAFGQLWGTKYVGEDSELIPIAWVASIETVQKKPGISYVQLDASLNYTLIAKAKPPFHMKQVRFQSVDGETIIAEKPNIYVTHSPSDAAYIEEQRGKLLGEEIEITSEMRTGPKPKQLSARAGEKGKLLLVHGYCSGPVWPVSQFTDAVEFQDFKQSRSQDEFAQHILKFGEQYGRYSIIGHSQGGLASVHLKAFYWSGLDNAENGRRVQSVGSPYQGCSMAGSLAGVGKWFGIGCGSNFDLTTEGAQLWLSTIPAHVRKEVYYYTTQYKSGFLSNCVTASNLVLHTPNDGTCEVKYAVLEGANDMGHKENWCHVSDMKFPPQCEDKARNKEMDAAAAR